MMRKCLLMPNRQGRSFPLKSSKHNCWRQTFFPSYSLSFFHINVFLSMPQKEIDSHQGIHQQGPDDIFILQSLRKNTDKYIRDGRRHIHRYFIKLMDAIPQTFFSRLFQSKPLEGCLMYCLLLEKYYKKTSLKSTKVWIDKDDNQPNHR